MMLKIVKGEGGIGRKESRGMVVFFLITPVECINLFCILILNLGNKAASHVIIM